DEAKVFVKYNPRLQRPDVIEGEGRGRNAVPDDIFWQGKTGVEDLSNLPPNQLWHLLGLDGRDVFPGFRRNLYTEHLGHRPANTRREKTKSHANQSASRDGRQVNSDLNFLAPNRLELRQYQLVGVCGILTRLFHSPIRCKRPAQSE